MITVWLYDVNMKVPSLRDLRIPFAPASSSPLRPVSQRAPAPWEEGRVGWLQGRAAHRGPDGFERTHFGGLRTTNAAAYRTAERGAVTGDAVGSDFWRRFLCPVGEPPHRGVSTQIILAVGSSTAGWEKFSRAWFREWVIPDSPGKIENGNYV